MRPGLRIVGSLLLLLFFGACSTVMPPEQYFEATTVDFTQRLRWMDYYGAARHLLPEHREAFLQRFTPLEDLRITDVRRLSAEPQPDGRVVVASVLEYYFLPSTTLRTFPFRQEWAYQVERKGLPGTWRAVTPFPEFRPRPERPPARGN
jgi:hypothetical protein